MITVRKIDDFTDGKEFRNTQPVDPPGCLSLGISYNSRWIRRKEMAVYARTSEGSGNSIGNEGLAGAGLLITGQWKTAPDRIYLSSPQIRWDHHESMYSENCAVSGAVLARGANGILMQKGDHYLLWEIDGTVLKLRRALIHTYEVETSTPKGGVQITEETEVWYEELISEPNIFDPRDWHVFSFSMDPASWTMYVDGQVVAEKELVTVKDVGEGEVTDWPDEGLPLQVGPVSGDIDEIIFLNRNFAGGMMEFLHLTSGSWESLVFDLADKYALHKITWDGYINSWMSARVTVRLSDSPDFEYFDEARFTLDHETVTYYPRTSEWIAGKYMKVIVHLTREDSEMRKPLINYIFIYLRKVPE